MLTSHDTAHCGWHRESETRAEAETQGTLTSHNTAHHLHADQTSKFHFLVCSFGGFLKVGQFQISLLLVSYRRNLVDRLDSQEVFHFLIFTRKIF